MAVMFRVILLLIDVRRLRDGGGEVVAAMIFPRRQFRQRSIVRGRQCMFGKAWRVCALLYMGKRIIIWDLRVVHPQC